ncbi:MAG: DUF1566 domain-containing protein [Deltaproteobacteria bacterium]|nr:DUF1566 domain-containing protein [Deltaproteobacteria bacterium]
MAKTTKEKKMKPVGRLLLLLSVLGFFLCGSPFAQHQQKLSGAKTKSVEALIKEINPDTNVIILDDYPGIVTYNKGTVFVVGDVKVSPSAVRKGTRARVTYTESLGKEDPPGSGIRPVSGSAMRIVLDMPLEAAQELSEKPQRFIDSGDGTITDTQRKLMWQKKDDGKKRTWKEAQDYVRSLRLAGHMDWRLPDPAEHDKAVVMMVMGKKRSEGTADWYWSSDQRVWLPFNYSATHLLVGPMISLAEPKKTNRVVRCVRELK